MGSNTVFFTHKKTFHRCLQKQRGCFLINLYKSWESLVTLQLPSCLPYANSLLLRRFLNKWIWKTSFFYFLYKPTKKRNKFLIWKCQVTMPKKGKNLLIWTSHVTMTKRDTCISNETQLKIILQFSFTKTYTSFSYQHFISFTHGLQQYCFLGQVNLYRLCGFWQMSRQIWTIFLVEKRFQLLGCKTQSIQEKWQERVPTGPKSYNGRGRFQPVYAIEESTGEFSKKICSRRKFGPVLIPTMSKHMDEQLKLAHKVVDVVDRANKDLCDSVAVQCGQAWEFLCSNPPFCKEDGGREIASSCLYEL